MKTLTCVVAAALVVLAAGLAFADEVTDAIGQAGSAYAAGDYKEASTQLQTALIGVNQRLIDILLEEFPEPPDGWTADEPEGMDASLIGASMFAGLVMSRVYHPPNGSDVEMTVAANSPALAMLRAFVGNPMLAAMSGESGMSQVTACGYDAIEQEDTENDSYDLHILAGNATLISISGRIAEDMDHVRTLAEATDCKGFVEVVE